MSFDGHCEKVLKEPQYTNLIIRNNPDSTKSKEIQKNDEKLQSELKYLHSRLDDEIARRKKAEHERDVLIASLDDMTQQARTLETTVRDFEQENIELYDKLKRVTQELTFSTEKNKEAVKKITDMQIDKDKTEIVVAELNSRIQEHSRKIEKQQEQINSQKVEIDNLRMTNKAYDISNKENFKNMNVVMEKIIYMSSERQRVKNEMDNIIQRRKSVKNLGCSNSFHNLPSKSYPYNPPDVLKELSSKSYCNYTEKKEDKRSVDRNS